MQPKSLPLESLSEGVPVLFDNGHVAILQKCVFSMDNQGHESGVILDVENHNGGECHYCLTWNISVTDQLKAAHADCIESVEDSAKAVSFLLIKELTPYKVARQAIRGTHVDFHLTDPTNELPFQNAADLECSGILKGDDSTVAQRIKEKRERLPRLRDFPVFIIVVEHGYPLARIEKVLP